jgi:hypothetical protein
LIGLGDPPIFAVEALALARRNENDFRGCRCDAEKNNSNNRERHPRHGDRFIYHFLVAVWSAKEAESSA